MEKNSLLKRSEKILQNSKQMRSASPGAPGLSLPSDRSIRRFLQPILCRPGHLENVIKEIGEKIQAGVNGRKCNLVQDEMTMRKALGINEIKTPKLNFFLNIGLHLYT